MKVMNKHNFMSLRYFYNFLVEPLYKILRTRGSKIKFISVLLLLVLSGLFVNAFSIDETKGLLADNAINGVNSLITNSLVKYIIKKSKEASPKKIIDTSDNHIKSFVSEDYFNKSIEFKKVIIFDKPDKGGVKYYVVYNLELTYEKEEGKRITYGKRIKVKLDENGKILGYIGPRKECKYLINKEEAISKAKKQDSEFHSKDLMVSLVYDNGFYKWKVTDDSKNKSILIESKK